MQEAIISPGRNFWHIGLILLAAFTLLRCLVWAFITPPFDAGDESAHLAYVMQLRNNGTVPVFKFAPDCSSGEDTTPQDPSTLRLIQQAGFARLVPFTAQPYESYQPPLYYLTAALFALPLPKDDALGTLYASRVASSVLVTLTVIIFAFALRELTLRPILSLAVTALVSSVPVFDFFGGIVNNDNMLNLFAAAILLAALRLIRSPLGVLLPLSLLLGALEGGALLSKASAIALIPVSLLAIAFAILRSQPPTSDTQIAWWVTLRNALLTSRFWRSLLGAIALYSVGLLLVDGWFILYNIREYGDLFGTANTIKYGATCWGPTIASQGLAGVPRFLMSLALITPFSFIATFGWGDESIGTNLYYVLILPFLLVSAYFGIRWLRQRFTTLPAFQQMDLLVLAALTLTNLIVWISFNFTIQYQPVGRYLYMALLPISGFLTIAPLAVPRSSRWRIALFLFALLALNLLTLIGWLGAGTGYMVTHARGL